MIQDNEWLDLAVKNAQRNISESIDLSIAKHLQSMRPPVAEKKMDAVPPYDYARQAASGQAIYQQNDWRKMQGMCRTHQAQSASNPYTGGYLRDPLQSLFGGY